MSKADEKWEEIQAMKGLSPKLLSDERFKKMILRELRDSFESPLQNNLEFEVDSQGALVLKRTFWAPDEKQAFNVDKEYAPSWHIPDKFDGMIHGKAVYEEIYYKVHELPRQSNENNSDDAYLCVTTRSATNHFLPSINRAYKGESVYKSTWHQGIEVARYYMFGSLITQADQLRVPLLDSRGWISDEYFPTYIDTLKEASFLSGLGIHSISISARQQGDTDGIIVKRESEINDPANPQHVETIIYTQASTRTPNELAGNSIIGSMHRNLATGYSYIEVGTQRFEPATQDANNILDEAIRKARQEYNELMTRHNQNCTGRGIHI